MTTHSTSGLDSQFPLLLLVGSRSPGESPSAASRIGPGADCWLRLLAQAAGGDGRLTAHPRHSAYEGRGAEGLATGVTDSPDEGRIAGTGAGSAVGTTAGLAGWLEALVGVGTAAGGVVGNGTSQSCTVSAAARSIGLRQQTGTGSFGSRQQIAPHERQ
jgi:hypothetical protein